jgi:hypothetical protein
MKAITECRREIVKDVCPVPKAGHEEQDWTVSAPIEQFKACAVDVYEPLHMGRTVNGPAIIAHRNLSEALSGDER